jgi:hypothetical protein
MRKIVDPFFLYDMGWIRSKTISRYFPFNAQQENRQKVLCKTVILNLYKLELYRNVTIANFNGIACSLKGCNAEEHYASFLQKG